MPYENRLLRFFANPAVGIAGSLASIIGLALAVAFYMWSKRDPDLVYTVHPVRTLIVQGNRPSGLRVDFHGRALEGSDVVGVQLAIWNQGRASIHPSHMLSPIEIRLQPPVPILEARVTKSSRPVSELRVSSDPETLKDGRVPVSWRILEEGDGGSVQLIYASGPDVSVTVEGLIEGQGIPRNLRAGVKVLSPQEQYRLRRRTTLVFMVVAALILVVSVGGTSFFVFRVRPSLVGTVPERDLKFVSTMIVVTLCLAIVMMIRTFWPWWSEPAPPFGF